MRMRTLFAVCALAPWVARPWPMMLGEIHNKIEKK
jgi:hypothetical protein